MKKLSYSSYKNPFTGSHSNSVRIIIMMIFTVLLFVIILIRLFHLQVIKHNEYSATAEAQHFGAIEIPARRSEILVTDTHSGEFSKLATNTTLDLLYVDPFVAEDKQDIAISLAPLLFTQENYNECLKTPDECYYNVIEDEPLNSFLTTEPVWDLGLSTKSEIKLPNNQPDFKSYKEVVQQVEDNILNKISKTEIDFVILKREAESDLMANIINERLPGIFVNTDRFMIYGNPTVIPENQLDAVSKKLASYLGQSSSGIKQMLTRKKVRYVFLKNKLDPSISRQIKEMKLRGVVLLPEHWRYYPEGELASNIVGFLNRDNVGQYGIEGFFNTELEGKKGAIYAEKDPFGRQITVGDSKIINAQDGDTIVLTIDRIVQKEVEAILAESTERFKADSGQVVIMDPFTGAIIAMVNYPSFNPNVFSEAYTLKKLDSDEEISKTLPVFMKDEKGRYFPASTKDIEDETIEKFIYENKFGPGVFKNKAVSEFYEPGSVFKPIIMAIALDAKEVEPHTTFIDDGPLKIDEFEIRNSDRQYHGKVTMTEVLEKSLNTGMSRVAQMLGRQLMYNYLKDFGFGEYTNIRLEGEVKGNVDYYKHWSKAQLLTTSYGQGIVVTPLQMVAAWAALANGGKLVQPYIVESIIKENQIIKTEPKIIHRVISEETSSIITSMLISVVHRGHGRPADIPGHLVAGKTGTSQIAGPGGRYETGEGSVITSFAGYFPAFQPRFIILVKFDRPRVGDNTWGSTTAAPTFGRIVEFLVDYYNIQSDS